MRTFLTVLAALGAIAMPASARAPATKVIPLYASYPKGEALVIPTASPVRLKSFVRKGEITATFTGRFTLTGRYEASGQGDDLFVSFWPDPASVRDLPRWRERGPADVFYLDNAAAFVEAVASPADHARMGLDDDFKLRGRVTIVADNYQTGIECDASHFSARFVSLVRPSQQIAAIDDAGDDC